MTKTFESSDGDIRAVLKTMIYSPEFWSREAYRAKIKTPFELVVSTARALGSDYIVVGRPILDAPDRVAACRAIVDELAGGRQAA